MVWEQFSVSGPQTSVGNRGMVVGQPSLQQNYQEYPYMSSMMVGNGYNPYRQQYTSAMNPWAFMMNGMNSNNLGTQIGSASAFANQLSSSNLQAKYPYQAMLAAEQLKGDRLDTLLNSPLMMALFGGGGGGGLNSLSSNFGQSVSLGGGGGGYQAPAVPSATLPGGRSPATPGRIGGVSQPAIQSMPAGQGGTIPQIPGKKPPGQLMVDKFGSNPLIRR